jgi:hypothetical protein
LRGVDLVLVFRLPQEFPQWPQQTLEKSSCETRSSSSTIQTQVILYRLAGLFPHTPQTRASPLTQRIQFLEAKGLTPAEIDLAVRQAAQGSSYAPAYAQTQYPLLPPPPYRWDWRDYFVGTRPAQIFV